MAPTSPGISIVVATLNRPSGLLTLLNSLTAFEAPGIAYEIIVVDNGSTDDTSAVVERFARDAPVPVRYLLERRRGASFARNTGVAASGAPIVAFVDDDQDLPADWLAVVARTFGAHPDVDVIGGRVRPRWPHQPPAWVRAPLLGPVSLIDRGPLPFRVTTERWMCLPGGNMAWRRAAFVKLGGFSPEYSRSQDRELTVRALLAGYVARYEPDMIVYHHIESWRLTKRFFRRWSRTEGRMRAGYAFEELFTIDGRLRPLPADVPRVLGVSRFVYRAWLDALRSYAKAIGRGLWDDAFRYETRLLYLAAYIRRRLDLTAVGRVSVPHRTSALVMRGVGRAAAFLGFIS